MEMQLSVESIEIAQSIGLVLALLIIFAILIGVSLFIYTRFYNWLVNNGFVEPKNKK